MGILGFLKHSWLRQFLRFQFHPNSLVFLNSAKPQSKCSTFYGSEYQSMGFAHLESNLNFSHSRFPEPDKKCPKSRLESPIFCDCNQKFRIRFGSLLHDVSPFLDETSSRHFFPAYKKKEIAQESRWNGDENWDKKREKQEARLFSFIGGKGSLSRIILVLE